MAAALMAAPSSNAVPSAPMVWEIAPALADVREAPSPNARLATQALHGERVWLLGEAPAGALPSAEAAAAADAGPWRRVRLERDGYEGFLSVAALVPAGPPATHRVIVPLTTRLSAPDVKSPALGVLPLGARVVVVGAEPAYRELARGGFLAERHLAPVAETIPDWVATAERFLHAPYLWGGVSALGIDCSGLVQRALDAAGLPAPRDSGPQATTLGHALPLDPAGLQRGDLVFWRGHVAIVRDAATLLHANAHAGAVALEPLQDALARIAAAGDPPLAFRRLGVPLA